MNVATRRMKLRRKKAIRAGIKNALVGMLLVVGMMVGIEMGLRAWESEMDANTQQMQDWVDKHPGAKVVIEE